LTLGKARIGAFLAVLAIRNTRSILRSSRQRARSGTHSKDDQVHGTFQQAELNTGRTTTRMQEVVAAYNAPNKAYDELQQMVINGHISSPLTDFSKACRAEVRSLGA